MRLHHVQVAMPRGGEADGRRFYADGLGLTEVAKPEPLRGRGGAWFRAYDENRDVTVELHLGVEEPFVPARRAHPALVLDTVADLDEVSGRLDRLGFPVDRTERTTLPGYLRCHVLDAHGNRVELLTPA